MVFDFCFLSTSQDIDWEQHLQNDLFFVEWDVKPYLSQSILTMCGFVLVVSDNK